MKLLRTLRRLADMPPSRRRQWLSLSRDRLLTRTLHAPRLQRCGHGTIVQKPLFWTPEFIELGNRVLIWRGCRIEAIDRHNEQIFEPRITFGDNVSVQQHCHITSACHLTIGSSVSIMYGVLITDIDHEYHDIKEHVLKQELSVRPTRIGDGCFIGAGARIQAGTYLGEHCIVGANAVVRGRFPDHCVIVGVPARIVKRFDSEAGTWCKTNSEGDFLP